MHTEALRPTGTDQLIILHFHCSSTRQRCRNSNAIARRYVIQNTHLLFAVAISLSSSFPTNHMSFI